MQLAIVSTENRGVLVLEVLAAQRYDAGSEVIGFL